MAPSDGKRFNDLVRGMARMYGQDIDKLVTDAYWLALRDWEYADFEAAAAHLMANSKFMPRPADFNALRKAGEPTAAEAWDVVLSGAALEPTSRAARAARTLGGQQHIRRMNIERELPFARRDFIAAYEDLTDVDPVRDALPQIAATGARIALRGPAPIANFLPVLERENAVSERAGQSEKQRLSSQASEGRA